LSKRKLLSAVNVESFLKKQFKKKLLSREMRSFIKYSLQQFSYLTVKTKRNTSMLNSKE